MKQSIFLLLSIFLGSLSFTCISSAQLITNIKMEDAIISQNLVEYQSEDEGEGIPPKKLRRLAVVTCDVESFEIAEARNHIQQEKTWRYL